MSETQSFQNHAKMFPPFHFVVLPILLSEFRLVHLPADRSLSAASVMSLLVAFALLMLAFSARIMALAVQDRVIRLEMRLRMQQVLPVDLRTRIAEFQVGQLGGAAVCGRCGTARPLPKSLAGQDHRPQSHQTVDSRLAADNLRA